MMMAASEVVFQNSSIQLKDVKLIAQTLHNMIIKSLGPKCQKSLITTSTGQVLVTSDGLSILTALSFSHPVAKCIVESVKSFANVYGDGCKTFIIYLYSLLSAIESDVKKLDCSVSDGQDAAYKNEVSKCLHDFMNSDLQELFMKMRLFVKSENLRGRNKSERDDRKMIKLIVKSFLMRMLGVETVDHLSHLVTSYVMRGCGLEKSVQMAREGFSSCVHTIPRQAYMSSYVSDGIFLQGQFHGLKCFALFPVKFILLQCQLDGNSEAESNYAVSLSDKSTSAFLVHRSKAVSDFLAGVKDDGIVLILTFENIPDHIIQTCLKLKVSIVHCMDSGDLDYLANISGKLPVTSLYERISEKNILFAASCEIVSNTDRPLIRLVFDESCVNYVPQSLFLCGPTVELCQHLKAIVRRCVKVIEHCLFDSHYVECKSSLYMQRKNCTFISSSTSDRKLSCETEETKKLAPNLDLEMNIIAGGGYFEFLLSHFMEVLSQQTVSPRKKFACSVLVKMLQGLTRILHNNCVDILKRSDYKYLSAHTEIMRLIALESVAGFDSQGRICDPLQNEIVDVLSLKFAAVYSSLSLVTRLLKVDSVLGVKRPNSDT